MGVGSCFPRFSIAAFFRFLNVSGHILSISITAFALPRMKEIASRETRLITGFFGHVLTPQSQGLELPGRRTFSSFYKTRIRLAGFDTGYIRLKQFDSIKKFRLKLPNI